MLDKDALWNVCLSTARQALWDMRPMDLAQTEALARQYLKEAQFHLEFLEGQGADPNILVRAVQYLAEVHVMPPMKKDVLWFRNMFEVLVELACPNCTAAPEALPFLRDIEKRIASQLQI